MGAYKLPIKPLYRDALTRWINVSIPYQDYKDVETVLNSGYSPDVGVAEDSRWFLRSVVLVLSSPRSPGQPGTSLRGSSHDQS